MTPPARLPPAAASPRRAVREGFSRTPAPIEGSCLWQKRRGERRPRDFFAFEAMLARVDPAAITGALGSGTHFWDPTLPWNGWGPRR